LHEANTNITSLSVDLSVVESKAAKLQQELQACQHEKANFEQLATTHLETASTSMKSLIGEQGHLKEKLEMADQALRTLSKEKEEIENRLLSSLQNVKEYEECKS